MARPVGSSHPELTAWVRFVTSIVRRPLSECWEWPHARQRFGYGRAIGPDGEIWGTHQLAWQHFMGPIPDGLSVLHHCDNPPCCNPIHLFVGTRADNMNDRWAKGRKGNMGAAKPRRWNELRVCEWCGLTYTARSPHARHCSPQCYQRHYWQLRLVAA